MGLGKKWGFYHWKYDRNGVFIMGLWGRWEEVKKMAGFMEMGTNEGLK